MQKPVYADKAGAVQARRRCGAALVLLLAVTAVAAGEVAVPPSTALTPRDVVLAQLEALQHNDRPYPDAGIEQAWALAHPQNKAFTGPLVRFAGMLRSPAFRAMLDHRSHSLEAVSRSAERVVFLVVIEDAGARAVGYEWTVERVRDGEFAGCWMTTSVSPPVPLGEII